ncbi:hemerythrin domain-containing protein [Kitasatospora sp. NPDC059327]|uniref:hemerythrin domain-containing protein n=1 Tax=Kitasatospora sp. NPDC059327 TaxID=3346803 RepID=UPI00369D1EAE
MSDRLPMDTLYLVHEVLRRELRHLALTPRGDGTLRRVLRRGARWELLRQALRTHHGAENEALRPVLRRALVGRPYDLALLEAMAAEHAAIASLIGAVDEALATPDTDPDLLGDLVHALVTGVNGHLRHAEERVFPLIQAVLTAPQWARFRQLHARRIAGGADTHRLLPWLLEGADEATVTAVLAPLPGPVRRAYRAAETGHGLGPGPVGPAGPVPGPTRAAPTTPTTPTAPTAPTAPTTVTTVTTEQEPDR